MQVDIESDPSFEIEGVVEWCVVEPWQAPSTHVDSNASQWHERYGGCMGQDL